MPVTATTSDELATSNRPAVFAQIGFSLVAAVVFAFRAARTDVGTETAGVALVALAGVLAVAAAVTATRSRHWAAVPLGGALFLELIVFDRSIEVAPPRLVNAIPLLFALAFAIAPGRLAIGRAVTDSPVRTTATVIGLALMVPVGFFYLSTGLIAPAPDVLGAYALFGVLLMAAVRLGRRGSWWVMVVPPLSVALWFLMVWFGETVLGWSP